jgi:hypothetical protein
MAFVSFFQFRRFFQFQLNFGKYFNLKRNAKDTSQHNYKINTAIHKEQQAVPYEKRTSSKLVSFFTRLG